MPNVKPCVKFPIVEDPVNWSLSYTDVTKGKSKNAIMWKRELAKKATEEKDKHLLEEIQRYLIK